MRIGVDIESNARFEQVRDSTFLRKVFTPAELAYAFARSSPSQHLCGMFCAKEAVRKTVADVVISVTDVEISHDAEGAPIATVHDIRLPRGTRFEVSISHCDDYSVANALRT